MQKSKLQFKIQKYFLIALVIFALFPSMSFGARFFVSPNEVAVGQESTIILSLDTEGQSINAVELNLSFSSKDFLVKSVSDGNSAINFWVEKPEFSNEIGKIKFSGIIANGYASDKADLLKINLIAKKEGLVIFNIENAKALLNDGQGTEAPISISNLQFTISQNAPSSTFKVSGDIEQPEAFFPQINRDSNIFNNKWFLVFATQDKGSGIERYEVQERRESKIFNLRPIKNNWKIVESPYQVQDQNLHSIIYMKAIDKDGNERTEMLLPQVPIKWYEDYYLWGIIIILVIIAVFAAKKWRKK